jgi:TPR repeat protein
MLSAVDATLETASASHYGNTGSIKCAFWLAGSAIKQNPSRMLALFARGLFLLLLFAFGGSPLRPTAANAAALVEWQCEGEASATCATGHEIADIYIYGDINDDTAAVIEHVDQSLPTDKPFPKVYINSEGGAAGSALSIGQILRRRAAEIEGRDRFFPDGDAKCYSACVLIALGAVTRQFNDIGVHQGHRTDFRRGEVIGVKPVEDKVREIVAKYLHQMGAPAELTEAMERTPFDDMTYFTYDPGKPHDAQPIVRMGFHMRIDSTEKSHGLPLNSLVYYSEEDQLLAGAGRGDVTAMRELGEVYLFGRGIARRNTAQGLKFLEMAADTGDVRSRHYLGVILSNGYAGISIDKAGAAKHHKIAAEAGHAGSQNNLGFMYFKGEGVERSLPLAVHWVTRSAEQGEPFAYGTLGEMYVRGDVFPPDDIEAYKWLKLAATLMPRGGSRDSHVALLAALTKSMKKEEIAEGEKRAAAWRPLKQTDSLMRDKDD